MGAITASSYRFGDAEDLDYSIAEFQRTGFQGGLNYYRSIQSGFELTAAFKGTRIRQPSFFLIGEADGLNKVVETTDAGLRIGLPGLRGFMKLPGVGHWPQREAPEAFNAALLRFLDDLHRDVR